MGRKALQYFIYSHLPLVRVFKDAHNFFLGVMFFVLIHVQLLLTLFVACDCLIQNNLQIFLYLCTVKQTNICTVIDYQQQPITEHLSFSRI